MAATRSVIFSYTFQFKGNLLPHASLPSMVRSNEIHDLSDTLFPFPRINRFGFFKFIYYVIDVVVITIIATSICNFFLIKKKKLSMLPD